MTTRADLPRVSSVSLLTAAIGALGSPLGPRLETDLTTDLYSPSTLIACYDETDLQVNIKFHRRNMHSRFQRRLEHWTLLYDPVRKEI
jgi:hypothetical protein